MTRTTRVDAFGLLRLRRTLPERVPPRAGDHRTTDRGCVDAMASDHFVGQSNRLAFALVATRAAWTSSTVASRAAASSVRAGPEGRRSIRPDSHLT